MSTRIRYSKLSDGSFVSMRVIQGKGVEFRSYLSSDGKSGFVENLSTKEKIMVTGTSAHKTKIAIRSKLEELGCRFTRETRIKETGETTNA